MAGPVVHLGGAGEDDDYRQALDAVWLTGIRDGVLMILVPTVLVSPSGAGAGHGAAIRIILGCTPQRPPASRCSPA